MNFVFIFALLEILLVYLKSTRTTLYLGINFKTCIGLFFSTQADTTHPLTKHRKIASSFRDSSLFDIFTLSCNLLKQVWLYSVLIPVPFSRVRVGGIC